jgi:hypothetical protein
MVSVQYAIPTKFAVHILRLDEMPNPLIGCLVSGTRHPGDVKMGGNLLFPLPADRLRFLPRPPMRIRRAFR